MLGDLPKKKVVNAIDSVLHLIIRAGRCCASEPTSKGWKLRERVADEEEVLLVLMGKRARLIEENEDLEARREVLDRPLPTLRAETASVVADANKIKRRPTRGNLISLISSETKVGMQDVFSMIQS